MYGMRVASRVGTSVLAFALLLGARASAQQCIAPAVARDLSSCEGFAPATPRDPGGRAGPSALPSTSPTVTVDSRAPRAPDLASPLRRPGNEVSRQRQYRLLSREREVLARLLGRMAPSDPQRAEVLQRLASTLGELIDQDNARARLLDQPIFEARQARNPREVQRLVRAQRAAQESVTEERQAAIRAYAALVSDFPSYPQIDEALYAFALLLEEMNDRQRARQVYHRLLREHPHSRFVPHGYLAFAEFYFAEGQLDTARQFYERVIAIPAERNEFYGYALYKLAWVRYNEEDHSGALDDFVRILEHTREYSDRSSSAALARQARRELVLPYARVGRPDRALAFFRRAAAHDDQAFEMLEELAQLYSDTGQWQRSIHVHHQLMAELPDSDALCQWQVRVLEATIASRPKVEQVRESMRLADVRRTFATAAHLPAAIRTCDEETATALLLLSTAWHREAIGTADQPGTRDPATMRQGSQLYDLLSAGFPNLGQMELPRIDRRDRPAAAEIAAYQGELLYELRAWPECAAAFERALDAGPTPQLAADAAYGAVLCYDRHLGSGVPPAAAPGDALIARALSEQEQRMERTFHRFACSASGHEALPVVLYRWARLHFAANHLEQAAVLFHRVAIDHPESDVAEVAANLWLESLNALHEHRPRPACLVALERALDPVERLYCDGETARVEHPDICRVAHTLRCQLGARRAERLASQGRFLQAGRALLPLASELSCADSPRYLYNAAIYFEAARMLGRAIRVRSVLIERFPADPLARRSIFLVGANYHALAIYEEAANWYEQYVNDGGECDPAATSEPCPDPSAGLRFALRFRLGLGQIDRAIEGARQFQRVFGRTHPGEAANVAFDIGVVHDRAGAWPRLIDHYRGFLRAHSRHATPAQLAAAHVAIARGWIQLGDRARAAPHHAGAIAIHERGGEEALSRLGRQEAERTRQLYALRDAVAEARYEIAEGLRVEYEALRFPLLRGSASVERVGRWAERDLHPWVLEKRRMLSLAEAAYGEVAPLGIPRWRIAAASRLGDMYLSFVEQVSASPIPESIERDPDLLEIYDFHVIAVTTPPRELAITRYESCLATATQMRWFDARSQRCEHQLNRLDAVRFPIASELRGDPRYAPDSGAAPGPGAYGTSQPPMSLSP